MDSLKKSMNANYFSFFNILIGTLSKIWFSVKKSDKRTKMLFYNFFCEFERLPIKIWKKEEHFAFILFFQGIQICSQILIIPNLNFLPLYAYPWPLTPLDRAKNIENCYFFFDELEHTNSNRMVHWMSFHQQKSRKQMCLGVPDPICVRTSGSLY